MIKDFRQVISRCKGKDKLGRSIDPNKFFDRPVATSLRNRSYAVEWYVREKSYCV